ncbi:hypothetical protein [Rhizorhabdus sp.]|uniref:hypothetical protein n=1 Tax=Rhizorhabdus sp. TaxID=1968843 RepID=UPI0019BCA5B0|nr:hypothetical protein [Rhizorhabdus sp.]MBD3762524.1 hypothetical protein [Rhizorhabdus sp.]
MTAAAAALAILCYISPNPLPMRVSVSGTPQQVAEVGAIAEKMPTIRLVAAAEDRGVAFARFETGPDTRYRDIGGLVYAAQRAHLLVATGYAIPNCPDGADGDVANPHAPPLRIGLIGDEAALARLTSDLPWARVDPLRLPDGRTGWHFAPGEQDGPVYHAFIERAARGAFRGIDVVQLEQEKTG